MLFSSYEFVCLFLPLTMVVFGLANNHLGVRGGIGVLLAASLIFYAAWEPRFLALLLPSIAINFVAGILIGHHVAKGQDRAAGRYLLALAVAANLGLLCWFKYAGFLAGSIGWLLGSDVPVHALLLPLGISFFTFEQIGYLVDVRRGMAAERQVARYALFVVFFPRLVAGPILRFGEVMPQIPLAGRCDRDAADIAVGLTIFTIGLFKKTVLADGIAPFADGAFSDAAKFGHIDLLTAWFGVISYTLQIYFDFSGYSDMAVGAARCFGIRFPMNFNAPYKALNIIEFWRRWHMTLSRFLRDYLYVSLGGNRFGQRRRYANLMATMLLGGLWHGANWTFVVWGLLHGIFLIINHGWQSLARAVPAIDRLASFRSWRVACWALTMSAVIVAWVFFRAPSFEVARIMLEGMAGLGGINLPSGIMVRIGPARGILEAIGIAESPASGSRLINMILWCVGLTTVVLTLPTAYEFLRNTKPTLEPIVARGMWLVWTPTWQWAIVIAILATAGLLAISRGGEFLYWQF